jgi:hypothetical protein
MPQANVTFFTSGAQPAFTTETRTGAWERQFAFGALEPTAEVYHAPFDQLQNSYVRPDNTANVNINGRIAYFCDDTGFSDRSAGLDTWTREVATLPANYNDAEPYSYPYPGYYLDRAPFTRGTTAKLVKEFFLIGNVAQGANYSTPFEIPEFAAQNFAWAYAYSGTGVNINGNIVTTAITETTILDGYLANANANLLLFASNPNLATYKTWAATDNSNAQSFSIEAADSVLDHIRGGIWMRTRRFVKAR